MARGKLSEYRRRRDFRKTAEPQGESESERPAPGARRFVVQKHAARRLHYDVRLELDGVLKSWAVPKGPSLDPADRRLAVQVEDHPLDYGDFEGTIPRGEYGGGIVLLWDRGTWRPDGDPRGLQSGKLKFHLEGEKLRGGWTLVRMGGDAGEGGKNWLLIKERDATARPGDGDALLRDRPDSVASGGDLTAIADRSTRVWTATGEVEKEQTAASELPGARRAPRPSRPQPELATLVADAPLGDAWLHEIKLDGYRILASIGGGKARLITRGGKDWTDRFRPVADALAALPASTAIVDGELVAIDADGSSDFQALQRAMREEGQQALYLYAFDLPYLDGHDCTAVPLKQRKAALAALVSALGDERVRYSDHVVGRGQDFYRQACRLAVEGVVSKRRDSPYRPGRQRDWLKTKCFARQEFVIGGYTEPSGARRGFGALLLGLHEGRGGPLAYVGRVGTGFDRVTLEELSRRLRRLERSRSPFSPPPPRAEARGAHWVRPSLVAEVRFSEWTADGRLRHPAFQGLREDKDVEEIVREAPAGGSGDRSPAAASRDQGGTMTRDARDRGDSDEVDVEISHPDRVLYPEQGLTKAQLVRYYRGVAERILPHVSGRPLTVVRCPRGRGGSCFYQKHAQEGLPEAIHGVEVAEKDGEIGRYLMVNSVAGLVSLVQIGVLEIHPWGAKADDLEHPDRLVFDLDPGPGVEWKAVAAAARRLRDLLAQESLQSFVKTTGGKGIHVVVPLLPRHAWDDIRSFSHTVAEALAAENARGYTTNPLKAKRKGRIFIDYLRNSRGATAVAPYSTRARAHAPVATPLRWDELGPGMRPDRYTVETLPRRLSSQRADAWERFFDVRQSLDPARARVAGGRARRGSKGT